MRSATDGARGVNRGGGRRISTTTSTDRRAATATATATAAELLQHSSVVDRVACAQDTKTNEALECGRAKAWIATRSAVTEGPFGWRNEEAREVDSFINARRDTLRVILSIDKGNGSLEEKEELHIDSHV